MSKWIYNTSGVEKTYVGVPIADGSFYQIPAAMLATYSANAALLADLANSVVKMSGDGTTAYSGNASQHIDFLKGSLPAKTEQVGITDGGTLRARVIGSHFATITAGQTQNIDWTVTQLTYSGVNKDSYFNGVQYYAENAVIGDTVSFQVVHPSLGVLDEFATGFYVAPNTKDTILLYRARLYPGTTIRIVYTSTGASDVNFMCNLFRHMDTV